MPFVDPRAHRFQLAAVGVTYVVAAALDEPLLLAGLCVVDDWARSARLR